MLSETEPQDRNTLKLPIEPAIPALLKALGKQGRAVLHAPPGAGKTTRVPLAMLAAGLIKGRILMLEPRRLATRAATERMAETLGQNVGETVGYRIRGDSQVSKTTRIEVVTEGILTRMIQSDPELTGIGAVIFDEFHERSLQADLGLALCLEIGTALRPDLMLLVMSATLDTGPVAALLDDAPVIVSEGRAYPVETIWLDQPWARPADRGRGFEVAMANLTERAIAETEGGVLVFLPGEGEIRTLEGMLRPHLPKDVALFPLYGALDIKTQRAAIAPASSGRKVVLATAIAETSLTIEDVRVVVDGGRARRARFDPRSGMTQLVTERVTRAEAEQRRGRAGRIAKGTCYRLWTRGEEGGLAPFAPAEIETADLTPLVLETAAWGARDPAELPFLTPPNVGAVAEAQSLLRRLGAITDTGAITPHGRAMANLPMHPRLAHMLIRAGRGAAMLAALLADRDPLSLPGQFPPADLALRLAALKDSKAFEARHPYKVNQGTALRIRAEARRLKPPTADAPNLSPAEMAALAYPDRIGLRRKGAAPRYLLSGSKGACFNASDPMATARLIVVTNLDGGGVEARIRNALEIPEPALRRLFGDQITQEGICQWSRRNRMVEARQQVMLGALVLEDRPWPDCPADLLVSAMIDGIRDLGIGAIPFTKAALLLIERVKWLAGRGGDMPDFSDEGLLDTLETWLAPCLTGCRRISDLVNVDLTAALVAALGWEGKQRLDHLAPTMITAPTGTRLAIDYGGEQPSISVRLQEMFGLTVHPTVGADRTPLLIELLSPAQRPVQTTSDLPGFWRNSYADVRKDMRGRYPRHPWPEDPTMAEPTRRLKPKPDMD
ncbi:MAG: ATP-dependent helicase HrpB [Rhodobacteraceae bacterium]|nr:ATP-dependent helicase HrpB [Paracoccaceae bacterium]